MQSNLHMEQTCKEKPCKAKLQGKVIAGQFPYTTAMQTSVNYISNSTATDEIT